MLISPPRVMMPGRLTPTPGACTPAVASSVIISVTASTTPSKLSGTGRRRRARSTPSSSRPMAASLVPPMSKPMRIAPYCTSNASLRSPPIQVARTPSSSSSQTRSARSPGASRPRLSARPRKSAG